MVMQKPISGAIVQRPPCRSPRASRFHSIKTRHGCSGTQLARKTDFNCDFRHRARFQSKLQTTKPKLQRHTEIQKSPAEAFWLICGLEEKLFPLPPGSGWIPGRRA